MANRYLDHNIQSSISVNLQKQIIFPAVTICNMNPVKRTAFDQANIQEQTRTKRRKKRSGYLKIMI